MLVIEKLLQKMVNIITFQRDLNLFVPTVKINIQYIAIISTWCRSIL